MDILDRPEHINSSFTLFLLTSVNIFSLSIIESTMPNLNTLILSTTSFPSPPPSPDSSFPSKPDKTPYVHLEGFWRFCQHPPAHLPPTDPSVALPWPIPDLTVPISTRSRFLTALNYLEYCLRSHLPTFEGDSDPDVALKGFSHCRICRKLNGRDEFWLRVDGIEMRWPEGLSHYVDKHDIWVGEEFWSVVMRLAEGGSSEGSE